MRENWGREVGRRRVVAVVALAGALIAYLGAERPVQEATATDRQDRSGGARDEQRRVPDDTTWDRFSADVTLRQARLNADGTPQAVSPPAVSFRVDRMRRAFGWSTSLTLTDIERPAARFSSGVRALDNPFLVVRMEYDGDGTPPRLYNRRGDRVRGPGQGDRQLLTVPGRSASDGVDWASAAPRVTRAAPLTGANDWIEGVIATRARRTARRQDLERRFGVPRERVAGLDRYLSTSGDTTYEVVVNPDTALPVEVNAVRGGALVARIVYRHESRADDTVVRRFVRRERSLPGEEGARAVTDVEVTNVTLTPRGAR